MNRFIAINPNRCTGCNQCLKACSEGHRLAGKQKAARLALVESPITAALTCRHCEGAPCMCACPVDAIRRDEDGCIRIDEHRCVGCKLCAYSCPFGSIRMGGTGVSGVAGIEFSLHNPNAKVHPLLHYGIGISRCAVKCDLCEADGYHPRCVDACITNALRLVSAGDPNGDLHNKKVRAGGADLAQMQHAAGVASTDYPDKAGELR